MCAVLVVTRLAAFWWRTDINFPKPEFFFPTGSLALARFMSKPARLVMRVGAFWSYIDVGVFTLLCSTFNKRVETFWNYIDMWVCSTFDGIFKSFSIPREVTARSFSGAEM